MDIALRLRRSLIVSGLLLLLPPSSRAAQTNDIYDLRTSVKESGEEWLEVHFFNAESPSAGPVYLKTEINGAGTTGFISQPNISLPFGEGHISVPLSLTGVAPAAFDTQQVRFSLCRYPETCFYSKELPFQKHWVKPITNRSATPARGIPPYRSDLPIHSASDFLLRYVLPRMIVPLIIIGLVIYLARRRQRVGLPTFAETGNTSGQGRRAAVPREVMGWNWGAFLLNWIWGLGNNTYLALLILIPIPMLGLVVGLALGRYGNDLAWKNKRWENVEHFKSVQKLWTQWAIGLMAVSILFSLIFIAARSPLRR